MALIASIYICCISDLEWLTVSVRVGDTSLDEEFEAEAFTIGVAAIKQHPQYNSRTLQNDISVLELTEAVSLTQYPNIKPVCLPEAGAVFQTFYPSHKMPII